MSSVRDKTPALLAIHPICLRDLTFIREVFFLRLDGHVAPAS
ncbi:hypothetical protein [Paenilisteria rocourtiae]|nr:hypothetical protein [Listeria rocourtiae]